MKEQPFNLKQFADIQITGVALTKGSETLLAQAVQSHFNNYYHDWLDKTIPILDNDTPRNCAKSSVGKQKLENLFTYMRNRQFGNAPAFPEAWARKELGLSSTITQENE